MYLWVKAFHIIAVICWFVGFFYLPRLFVHHALSEDKATQDRFIIMERKLYRGIMTPIGIIAVLLGSYLIYLNPAFMKAAWLHAKLTCVALLIIHHIMCGHYIKLFKNDANTHSHVYYRWFNEAPSLLLLIIVILVVVKPF